MSKKKPDNTGSIGRFASKFFNYAKELSHESLASASAYTPGITCKSSFYVHETSHTRPRRNQAEKSIMPSHCKRGRSTQSLSKIAANANKASPSLSL